MIENERFDEKNKNLREITQWILLKYGYKTYRIEICNIL